MSAAEMLKNMTVLLVEDEQFPREAIGRFLKSQVAAVHLAANGLEGLELFSTVQPDVVITDLEMPVMNGLEMIRKIRTLGRTVPIIIVTGYDDDQHKTDLADRTLIKPIVFSKLLEALESCLKEQPA